MPEDGLQWLPRSEVLTFEEITRVAQIMVNSFGVDAIRITGGEPTVRANLPVFVKMLAALKTDLSMTTNGVTLPLIATELRNAGLRRINISCDSLNPETFKEITRRDDLDKVLEGIDSAIAAGFDQVKINCVVMRGINDDEIADFVHFGKTNGVEVRFIEFMPLDADGAWSNDTVVPVNEIRDRINAVSPITQLERTTAPATRYRFTDDTGTIGPQTIGIVASVSDSFCSTCDRVRLTADGQFRNCLFATDETDLRALLRSGATDEDIAQAVSSSVASKWAGHQINQVHFIRPKRSMSQIGG